MGTEIQARPAMLGPAQQGGLRLLVEFTSIFHQPMGWGNQERVTQLISCFHTGNLAKWQPLACSPRAWNRELKGAM